MSDPLRALRSRNFQLFTLGGLASAMGGQIFSVALGWELYERTHDPGALGLVGLLQVIPVLTLALPAGDLADRTDRRLLMLRALPMLALCPLLLSWFSYIHAPLPLVYAAILLEAICAAVVNPARQAILPQLVDEDTLASAIAWNSSRWQMAATLGPALGGGLIAFFKVAWPVYLLSTFTMTVFWFCVLALRPRPLAPRPTDTPSESIMQRLAAGASFVRSMPLMLAALTLDMVAVLLGGAVALLPVYARDILHTGPTGLGWLRAAPAVGALLMGLYVAWKAPLKKAGIALLWAVIGFGLATIVFGLSKNFYLSLLALAITGACDNISVVVRHTLVQALTPNYMQGRVSAVNSVFISISNELGAAESGYVARWLGTVTAVVVGGVGTILSVIGVHFAWPQVSRLGPLAELRAEKDAER
ncbi:MAG: MFS transporter [Armatimonas sp.]